ncbi:TIGR03364 family FAD-dependent oxidoreductase [soil metagenome]
MNRTADVAIVGGGIVGLAHAYMALKRGLRVVLFEREQFAVGASVRNFGMIWPIGQEPGLGLDRALRSRQHWIDVTGQAGIWCNPGGSLHLAYEEDEAEVLEEFMSIYSNSGYQCKLIDPSSAIAKSKHIKKEGLKSALWSETEMTVYPREAIRRIPLWLEEKYGLVRRYGQVVTEINLPYIRTSREIWNVERAVVCSGADFESLYPYEYDQQDIIKCKLQMMKLACNTPIDIGPSLCAGLTLRHYSAFAKCKSLEKLDKRFDSENPKLKEHGIHILVSQNDQGELIIGDSHHYYKTIEPFDSEEVNNIILKYLQCFLPVTDYTILERWHGVYPKYPGHLNLLLEPAPGVQIVNGLGGAGMTMSFGLAEEIVSKW